MIRSAQVLTSRITCPLCGHNHTETMPIDACQWFYQCKSCGELLSPKKGDCCVFCSYGTVACPPVQKDGKSCCSS
ncbi:GDCCVxC domain-containing (seleno)protein [Microbulbifer sp. DLAB2-AA]|uniref:GDCCVxC domain-containing (seleno)protein n=1 Tax=Microbulbifer sp. DLAB2-AA TaxID=3243394 RepID=UPI00403A6902